MKQPRLVVTMSVIPPRVDSVKRTIATVVRQKGVKISQIYLFYPEYCKRLGTPYPPPPRYGPLVKVVRTPDYGPITKLLPLLDLEKDPNTIVAILDDDQLYHPRLLSKLLKYYTKFGGNAGVGIRGHQIRSLDRISFENKTDRNYIKGEAIGEAVTVDWLSTFQGVIYPRKAFPVSSQELAGLLSKLSESDLSVDDVIIGYIVDLTKVSKYVIPFNSSKLGRTHNNAGRLVSSKRRVENWNAARNLQRIGQGWKKNFNL